jgi:GT2 family glycosyltransferase
MSELVVGIPTFEGHAAYLDQLLAALRQQTVPHDVIFCNTGSDAAYQHRLEATGHRVLRAAGTTVGERITNGRNAIRDAFLQSEATHLCWVDMDITMPAHAFARLLSLEKDIVGGAYLSVVFHDDEHVRVEVVAYFGFPDDQIHGYHVGFVSLFTKAVLRVDFIGFGCCLMRRAVLEQIAIPAYEADNSEDFLFCAAAAQQGYAVFLDSTLWLQHHHWPPGDPRNRVLSIEYQAAKVGLPVSVLARR